MVTVVVYHVTFDSPVSSLLQPVLDANEQFHQSDIDLIGASCRSAKHFMPDCKYVFLTDLDTEIHREEELFDEIHRFPRIDDRIMIHRMRAYAEFLERRDHPQNFVFCDSDVIVNRDLSPLFETRFDVGVTFRLHPSMPFNTGVILTKGLPSRAAEFFRAVVDHIEYGNPKQQYWYGDQVALADLLIADSDLRKLPEVVRWEDCEVRIFPCEIANYTPEDFEHPHHPNLRAPFLLHLKGNRKTRIREFLSAMGL